MAWMRRRAAAAAAARPLPPPVYLRAAAGEAAREAWRAQVLAALPDCDVWPRPSAQPAGRAVSRRAALAAAGTAAAVTAAALLGKVAGGWAAGAWQRPLGRRPGRAAAPPHDSPAGAAGGDPSAAAEPAAHGPAAVAAPADWWADRALEARLAAAAAAGPPRPGRLAVAVRHLVTGATAGLTADEIMPPASVFKLGLLVEAFRQIEAGRLTQEERLLLRPEDWAPGAGVLQARIGQQVTVGEALRLLIGVSDNTAALALLRRLGVDAVNAGYRRHGLARTRIYLDHRPDTTTAAETATLLALLATGRLAGPAATQQMLDLLAQEQPQAWIRPGLPPGTAVAHKSGQLPGVRNDAAVVYGPHGPYVLVVLADRLDRPGDEAAGEQAIRRLAREAEAYFAAFAGSLAGL